ncbi:hypothetical protein D9V86_06260 [Bacteroidetes/Chlorobi group bacterium ChocPot_Mid]|nr:MAG: hypothetical protein D9V86_06260 [Bacteroidetes/Chlorobi group bacterium ChocPot_Mid]
MNNMIKPYIALDIPYGYALTRVDDINKFVGIIESTEPLASIANDFNLRQRDIIEIEMDDFECDDITLEQARENIDLLLNEFHANIFNEIAAYRIPLIYTSKEGKHYIIDNDDKIYQILEQHEMLNMINEKEITNRSIN